MSNPVAKLQTHPNWTACLILKKMVDCLDKIAYSGGVRFSDSYKGAVVALLDASKGELSRLLIRREQLGIELQEVAAATTEVENQIKFLEGTLLRHTEADPQEEQPLQTEKSFTNAVIYVLKGATRSLSPVEIKDRLLDLGYDASDWKTDVVSSVHTILKRQLAAGNVEESGEPRRKVYRWVWHKEPEIDFTEPNTNGPDVS